MSNEVANSDRIFIEEASNTPGRVSENQHQGGETNQTILGSVMNTPHYSDSIIPQSEEHESVQIYKTLCEIFIFLIIFSAACVVSLFLHITYFVPLSVLILTQIINFLRKFSRMQLNEDPE